jgi:hypothetical protein
MESLAAGSAEGLVVRSRQARRFSTHFQVNRATKHVAIDIHERTRWFGDEPRLKAQLEEDPRACVVLELGGAVDTENQDSPEAKETWTNNFQDEAHPSGRSTWDSALLLRSVFVWWWKMTSDQLVALAFRTLTELTLRLDICCCSRFSKSFIASTHWRTPIANISRDAMSAQDRTSIIWNSC